MFRVEALYNFALKTNKKNSKIHQESCVWIYIKLKEESEFKNSKHEIQNFLDLEHIIFST